jgi:hypothetical protein
MKPRIFVSSTYFDLKHVRERIERFIESYNFEPVLFESDNVLFEHDKPLDLSCYNEVKLCHMMILIIGGRYGSAVSGDNLKEKKDFYNNDYTSITRKEFETAARLHIPVFIFIEKNVYAEYHTYNKNKNFFDNQINSNSENKFTFAHVDDINVFKFIHSIERNAIKAFEKIEDIEHYLKSQIAGMLYLYLQQLQDKKEEEKLLDSVSELKNISQRMNEMILAVGLNVIQDSTSFQAVIYNQNKILLEFFVGQFSDNIEFKYHFELSDDTLKEINGIIKETIFNIDRYNIIQSEKGGLKQHNLQKNLENEFRERLEFLDERLQLENFNLYKLYQNFFKKVYPVLNSDESLSLYFDEIMLQVLQLEIDDLSF